MSDVPNFAPFRQKSLGDCTRHLLPTQGWHMAKYLARYWFAVYAGKIGSPVKRFINRQGRQARSSPGTGGTIYSQ